MRAVIRFAEKNYAPIVFFLSLLVLALNYHATAMQGILPYYEDFARIIAAGFDPAAGRLGVPTFPIWGYGWVILALRSKLVILLCQQAVALIAVVHLVRTIEASATLPPGTVRLFKLFLVISFPFFAFNSVLWPYSFAASLIVISLSTLARAATAARLTPWIVSGILFGLALNFRSDFIFFPPVVVALLIIVPRPRPALSRIVCWFACVYILLLPWGFYARHATGHFSLTSSNSGQVLFAGLGQLPGNKWGITPSDGDPVMLQTVAAHLGSHANSLSPEASEVLKDAVIGRLIESPGEYLKKILYGVYLTVTMGFYPGSFYETSKCLPDCYPALQDALNGLKEGRATEGVSPARAVAHALSVVYSRLLLFLCFLSLPFAIRWGWRARSVTLALATAASVYQASITTFTYHLPGYSSTAYLFHLLALSTLLGWFVIARKRTTGHL